MVLATRVYNIMRLRMTWQLVAERAVASTRLLAWMLCVICGGHYYLYEQRQRRHGGSTRTAEGAGARDGSWAHVRERMLPFAVLMCTTPGTAPAGCVTRAAGRYSVESWTQYAVESLYTSHTDPRCTRLRRCCAWGAGARSRQHLLVHYCLHPL